jgi:hypothetical protein
MLRQFDSSSHRDYRTKRVILEIYDEMKRTMETGAAYRTRLEPPPANGWTPPELPQEKAEEKSVVQAGMSDAKQQSDLFQWQAEAPQQKLNFDSND